MQIPPFIKKFVIWYIERRGYTVVNRHIDNRVQQVAVELYQAAKSSLPAIEQSVPLEFRTGLYLNDPHWNYLHKMRSALAKVEGRKPL
jgi:hypothetical protein